MITKKIKVLRNLKNKIGSAIITARRCYNYKKDLSQILKI